MPKREYNNELDKRIKKWLEARGIDINYVSNDYTVTREHGTTWVTIKLVGEGFMLEEVD